jgi:hypothetical protein
MKRDSDDRAKLLEKDTHHINAWVCLSLPLQSR